MLTRGLPAGRLTRGGGGVSGRLLTPRGGDLCATPRGGERGVVTPRGDVEHPLAGVHVEDAAEQFRDEDSRLPMRPGSSPIHADRACVARSSVARSSDPLEVATSGGAMAIARRSGPSSVRPPRMRGRARGP